MTGRRDAKEKCRKFKSIYKSKSRKKEKKKERKKQVEEERRNKVKEERGIRKKERKSQYFKLEFVSVQNNEFKLGIPRETYGK